MNCREFQGELVQLPDDNDTEVLAHSHSCAACSSLLKDRRRQEEWLQKRFEIASTALLAKAPLFSDLSFSSRTETPPLRFSWVIASVVALATIILGLWQWNGWGGDISRSISSDNRLDPQHITPATAEYPSGDAPAKSLLPPAEANLSEIQPNTRSLTNITPTPAPFSTPAVSTPLSPTEPLVAATHVFKMDPTALAPEANGYLATIVPNDPTTQAPAMVALSLSGLPPNSLFHVRTSDVNGQQVWLASLMTDANGLGAVMLRTADATTPQKSIAAGARASSPRTTDPVVNLDLGDDNSPPGGAIDIVDNNGNPVLHVSSTKKPKHKRSN